MTSLKPDTNDSKKSKQELLNEIGQLQQELTAINEESRASKERDEILSRAIKLGDWVWDDLNKKPIYISEQLASIFGFSQSKMYEFYQCEDDIFPYIHPDDLENYKKLANSNNRVLDVRGQAHVFEYRIVTPGGEIRHVREVEHGVDDENGVTARSYGVVQDITELKEIEESLREAKESLELVVEERTQELTDTINQLGLEMANRENASSELEIKNAELERFAYTVSHDLKSPLVTIKGFVGLLGKDIADNATDRVAVDMERISSATDTMDDLLSDLLELSRIGRIMGEPESCNLSEIARRAADLVKTQADELGVEIVIDDMPVVRGDRTRLVEVYLNLIENAIKFMGEQQAPRLHIGAVEKDSMINCFVQDNGVGISVEYQQQIFGLFERLDPGIDGTGVGLALVKRIVEVHGGDSWIESNGLGQGSKMSFTLPKTQ